MKKNMGHILVLFVLIMACIWQTVTLWLGDASGHNFFASTSLSYEGTMLYPKEVWTTVNRSIYKVLGSNEQGRMRYELLYELFNEVKKDNVKVESAPKISYAELLSTKTGLIYEYGTRLSLEEIVGESLKDSSTKYSTAKIQTLYVDLSGDYGEKVYVYLIDCGETQEDIKVVQRLAIGNQLPYHQKVVSYFKEQKEEVELKMYQASLLSSTEGEFFAGNVFYPIYNQDNPIDYNKLKLRPLVTGSEDEALRMYVNGLLKNPNDQTITHLEEGVTFSDNLNLSVKYSESGTLEFKRTLGNESSKSTASEKLAKVMQFVKNSQAIPQDLKKGLYLQEITEDKKTGETRYLFGYQYANFDVILSDEVKAQLDVAAFLELGIKNSEITSGKWLLFDVVAEEVTNSNIYELTKECNDAINDIMGYVDTTLEEGFKLQDLQCAYHIKDINESLELEWIGTYRISN